MSQNPKTVIFLDFDGPLSSLRNTIASGELLSFDPIAVRFFDALCCVCNAKIVCTSTRSSLKSSRLYNEALKHFKQAGLNENHIHPDWSVNDPEWKNRKQNILTFLNSHPEISRYVIVDDERVDLPNFVRVYENDGVLLEDMSRICEVLDVSLTDIRRHYANKRKNLTP